MGLYRIGLHGVFSLTLAFVRDTFRAAITLYVLCFGTKTLRALDENVMFFFQKT